MAERAAMWTLLVLLAAVACLVVPAAGHARLASPQPRTNSDNLTTGPCGGTAPGSGTETTLAPGTHSVEIDATIPHAGTFRIAIASSPDENFDAIVLTNSIEADGSQELYRVEVEIPDIDCENCALQIVQQANIGPDYYSCADIRITGSQDPEDYDHQNPSSNGFSLAGLFVTLGLLVAGVAVLALVVVLIAAAVVAYKNPEALRKLSGRPAKQPAGAPYVRYEDAGINLDA